VSREKPSKSQRIQEYLSANPQARNRDCVAALKEFGVTAADVSNAKSQLKKKFTRRRAGGVAVVAATLAADPNSNIDASAISLSEIDAAIEYVQNVGDIKRAQQLLLIIQQIRDL